MFLDTCVKYLLLLLSEKKRGTGKKSNKVYNQANQEFSSYVGVGGMPLEFLSL